MGEPLGRKGFEIVPTVDQAQLGFPENYSNVGIDLFEANEKDIDRVKDINLYQVNGRDFPYIRVHYKENDVYFTFPDSDPRSTVAAMIIFVNHAWTISKMVINIKNIERSLRSGTLNMGEDLPKFLTELPRKADEECHQCGKSLIEDELDMLAQDVRECLSCSPEMH